VATLFPHRPESTTASGEANVRTDEEIKFRLSADEKALIQWAADSEGSTLTQFVRGPALTRARELKAESDTRQITIVPKRFFDDLNAALAAPAEPIASLQDAARRLLARNDLD
jgi:uncharacterized protein (DUF1778 family)